MDLSKTNLQGVEHFGSSTLIDHVCSEVTADGAIRRAISKEGAVLFLNFPVLSLALERASKFARKVRCSFKLAWEKGDPVLGINDLFQILRERL